MSAQQQSHSELFGLKGQDTSGLASEKGKTQAPPKEGEGVLGGAEHPTGAASGGSEDHQNTAAQGQVQSTVGGMTQGTDDNTVPGSGSSLATPSQGSGKIGANDQQSTGEVLGLK